MPAIMSELLRVQLRVSKAFLSPDKLNVSRAMQNVLGELMAGARRFKVAFDDVELGGIKACHVSPKGERKRGTVLYLHGGGYVAGGLPYAKGFAGVMASELDMPVLCAAYRLAPEEPYPAALEDAFSAYTYLLDSGIEPSEIVLCGESAGGGLILALTLMLKERGMELPAGLIAISPWTDLTMSGQTIRTKEKADPCLSPELLEFYAEAYAGENVKDPHVSPLFADLSDFPPTLIFTGSDEMLLDDAVRLDERLRQAGSKSELVVEERMWHAYVLYGTKEAQRALSSMCAFIGGLISE